MPFIEKLQQIQVDLSPDIAEELSLQDGDTAEVYNDRGRLRGRVKIMKQAHPKTVNIDEGMWAAFGGSVNMLTKDSNSDNGMGSTLFDCLVAVKKDNLRRERAGNAFSQLVFSYEPPYNCSRLQYVYTMMV